MMKENVIEKLNELNRRFYDSMSEEFDSTRNAPWSGWERVLGNISASLVDYDITLNVLDLGCGNGRFFEFLKTRWQSRFKYTGIDYSEQLLSLARKRYSKEDAKFIQGNLLNLPKLIPGEFNLIIAFGVMHHIPGKRNRINFIKNLGQLLEDNGYFAATFWNFITKERFQKKIVPWESIGLTSTDVEFNDFLIDWGGNRKDLRYVHHFDQSEVHEIFIDLGLKIYDEFRADGRTNDLNHYIIAGKN